MIVELTENNLVLFLKKLECSSQLGRVSAVKPYTALVGEICKSNTPITLTLFWQMKRTQCAQKDEDRQQTANIADN